MDRCLFSRVLSFEIIVLIELSVMNVFFLWVIMVISVVKIRGFVSGLCLFLMWCV